MINATDGWAVGIDGTIIHWNGTVWMTVTSPTTNYLESVFMTSATDGWAVGGSGTIIHWNGAEWTNVTSPTTSWLLSISMASPDDGWAVGYDGAIIRWNGKGWVPEFPTIIFMPLLIVLTLVASTLAKTASKKREDQLPSKRTTWTTLEMW